MFTCVFFSLKASFCFLQTKSWCGLPGSYNLLSSVLRTLSQKDFGMFRCFGKLQSGFTVRQSSRLSYRITPCYWADERRCELNLCLKVSLNLCSSSRRLFLHHSNLILSFPSGFSCGLVQWGWLSVVGLKRFNNILYGGNRNIGVSGDVLVALRLSELDYNLVIRWCSAFLSSVRDRIAVCL